MIGLQSAERLPVVATTKRGRLVVPQNENKLAGDVLQWCEDKWERQPPVSDLREAVKAVCAALRGI